MVQTRFLVLLYIALSIYSVKGLSGSLHVERINSDSLNRAVDVEVYLPPQYDSSRKYPLLVFLHGTELDHDDYPEVPQVVEQLIQSGRIPPMMVVKPNGNWPAPTPESIWDCPSMPSWWVNNRVFGNYEDFVAKDLIDWVARKYSLDKNRVALSGHSAGGFGSLRIGFKHTDVFSAVIAHSGAVLVEQFAEDMLTKNEKWWLAFDGEGIRSLADLYEEYEAPSPQTKMSPSLGYFSDLQWKLNYVFSPSNQSPRNMFPFAWDPDHVHNIFVGSPDPDSIENISIRSSTFQEWKRYNVDDLAISRKSQVEKLDFLYFDVGRYDDFLLQDDAKRLDQVLRKHDFDLEWFYEEFDTGVGCVRCVPNVSCGAEDFPCGLHFSDWDGLTHGSCSSRFYGGIPYTGSIGSRVSKSLEKLADVWENNSNSRTLSNISSGASLTQIAPGVVFLVSVLCLMML